MRCLLLLILVAVLIGGLSLLFGCRTYPREPVAHPPPPEAVPDEEPVPSDEIEWRDALVNDTLAVYIDAEPMPEVDGPHMLMHLEVPNMMCPNCERAVTRLAQSVPRTRVVAIDHETGRVHLLVPVAASARVVRVLSTNGWTVVTIDSEVEPEGINGPFEMAQPYQQQSNDNADDETD